MLICETTVEEKPPLSGYEQAEQDMYRAHIASIVNQIDSVDALRKIYTVAKTFLKLRQQEGAEHGNI